MTMHLLTRLILALQTKESIIIATFIETCHPRFFFIDTLWVAFEKGRFGYWT